MKNLKLITLLGMLAILSFSCVEEINYEEDLIDSSKYLFKTNSKYYYNIEEIDSNGNTKYNKTVIEVYNFVYDSVLRNSVLSYKESNNHNNTDRKNLLYADKSEIYGANTIYNISDEYDSDFPQIDNFNYYYWSLIIDLNRLEWSRFYEINEKSKHWDNLINKAYVFIDGKKISEELINYNGEWLNSFNIELNYEFTNLYYLNIKEYPSDYPKDSRFNYKRNFILVENIGIIKDNIEITESHLNKNGYPIDTLKVYKTFNLQKIEKLD